MTASAFPAKKILLFILSLLSMLIFTGSVTFSPIDAENIKLNFSVISDTHIKSWSDDTTQTLITGLKDMKKAEIKSDALIISGDITESATDAQYSNLLIALKLFSKTGNTLLAMGNHDVRATLDSNGVSLTTYEENIARYNQYRYYTGGIEDDTVYYYRIINGCYFIILNSQALENGGICIKADQRQWIDNLLAEASAGGKPVFVVCHNPFDSTNGVADYWPNGGGIGGESETLYNILQKYNGLLDIFFISGHLHSGLGTYGITNDGTVYFVDMPSYGFVPNRGYRKAGTGYQVELYSGEILFRARNFSTGEWLSDYDKTITLINQ